MCGLSLDNSWIKFVSISLEQAVDVHPRSAQLSAPPPGYSNVGISRWFVLILLKFKEADRSYLIKAQKDNSAID